MTLHLNNIATLVIANFPFAIIIVALWAGVQSWCCCFSILSASHWQLLWRQLIILRIIMQPRPWQSCHGPIHAMEPSFGGENLTLAQLKFVNSTLLCLIRSIFALNLGPSAPSSIYDTWSPFHTQTKLSPHSNATLLRQINNWLRAKTNLFLSWINNVYIYWSIRPRDLRPPRQHRHCSRCSSCAPSERTAVLF